MIDKSLSDAEMLFIQAFESEINTQRDECSKSIVAACYAVADTAAASRDIAFAISFNTNLVGNCGNVLAGFGVMMFKLGQMYVESQ
jgi:hypothetical protein